MDYEADQIGNFSSNLRFLCERHGSISAVCRKVKLNRQQFNKYLSGLHMPSPQNLRLISNFFGLSVRILFSNPEEFRTLIEGNFFQAMDTMRKSSEMSRFVEEMIVGSSGDHKEIIGTYDRYQFSSIYKGLVLRSAFCIYRNQEFLQHYYIERFPNLDVPSRTEQIFKYYGYTIPIAGRLFTADFEGIQRNEITFGVFAPVRRSASKFMFGISSGISATMFRQPYSTKVALHYNGPGLLRRQHLDGISLLERNDPSIPREVLQFLGDGSQMIQLM